MSGREMDPTSFALCTFAVRVGNLCDLLYGDPLPGAEVAAIIAEEASLLVRKGPDAYMEYVAQVIDLHHSLFQLEGGNPS